MSKRRLSVKKSKQIAVNRMTQLQNTGMHTTHKMLQENCFSTILKIKQRAKVSFNYLFCKKCLTPYTKARVRIKSRRVIITCGCGAVRRKML